MKKTALITLEYPPMIGGVSQYYSHMVEELPEESIVVLDNAKGKLMSRSRFVYPKWLGSFFSVWNLIRKEKVEQLLVGQLLPLGTVALVFKKLMGIEYTVMTHAMDVQLPFTRGGRKKWLAQRILAEATHVTTVSRYTKQRLVEHGVTAEKIEIIYPCPHISGIDSVDDANTADIRTQFGLRADSTVLLSVCRLVERKGIDTVLQALAILENTEIEYCIVGGGVDEPRLREIVKRKGLEQQVHFLGAISDEELEQMYIAADIFIMPSREIEGGDVEGFGIVFVEANSFGLPVIGGKSGGVVDAIIDGETGVLVEPESAQMVSDAIKTLFTDKSYATRLGEQGKKRVEEFFQWSNQAQRLKELLESNQ